MRSEAEIKKALESWRAIASMDPPGSLTASEAREMKEIKSNAVWWVHGAEFALAGESFDQLIRQAEHKARVQMTAHAREHFYQVFVGLAQMPSAERTNWIEKWVDGAPATRAVLESDAIFRGTE